jgi:hypothetical protein
MTSIAYELHKLHPLKGAGSLGASSPIGGPLVSDFEGRTALNQKEVRAPDHGAE